MGMCMCLLQVSASVLVSPKPMQFHLFVCFRSFLPLCREHAATFICHLSLSLQRVITEVSQLILHYNMFTHTTSYSSCCLQVTHTVVHRNRWLLSLAIVYSITPSHRIIHPLPAMPCRTASSDAIPHHSADWACSIVMSLPTLPCINPNPDIAGVGVRVSIYVQAFFSLVTAIVFAWDGKISHSERKTLNVISTNLILTACALLLSAFVQAATFGMSVYHALIVLNLSWINSASSITSLLLEVATTFEKRRGNFQGAPVAGRPAVTGVLVVIHLCAMATLGNWVWFKVGVFGDQLECTPKIFLTFGMDIPVMTKSLRITSIALYVISVILLTNISLFAIVILSFSVAAFLPYLAITRLWFHFRVPEPILHLEWPICCFRIRFQWRRHDSKAMLLCMLFTPIFLVNSTPAFSPTSKSFPPVLVSLEDPETGYKPTRLPAIFTEV